MMAAKRALACLLCVVVIPTVVQADLSKFLHSVNTWEEFESGFADFFMESTFPSALSIVQPEQSDFENLKADLVRFYLYTDSSSLNNPDELFLDDYESVISSRFNKDYPVRFFIHGFGHNASCSFPQQIKDVYIVNGIKVNMIAVDWGALSMDSNSKDPLIVFKNYKIAVSHAPLVGKRVGDMISFLYQRRFTTLRKVHIVGFSLGAHVAGYAGEHVFRGWFTKIARITGLDPAGPLFLTGRVGRHLRDSDAEFVDVIHTDMGQCGTIKSVGHANFFANGGLPAQPGCLENVLRSNFVDAVPLALSGTCSHSAAPNYYALSIIQTKPRLRGVKCFGYMAYSAGLCFFLPSANFGENCQQGADGDYYLDVEPMQSRKWYSC